jgi:hypothetical protein
MAQQDQRARLRPKALNGGTDPDLNVVTNDVLGPCHPSNILFPLWSTGGVLFPYTPSVATGSVAEYDPTSFIHSNYGYNAYVKSYPKPISISAEFTAQSNDEALYLLAVIHFFRSITKSYFGVNPYQKAGTPPPTLVFNYLGDYQFNNVPVIIKSFEYTLPADIDYVPVNTVNNLAFSNNIGVSLPAEKNSGYTWVPTHISVQLDLDTQYIPIKLRNEFNLDKFRSGAMVNKGYI